MRSRTSQSRASASHSDLTLLQALEARLSQSLSLQGSSLGSSGLKILCADSVDKQQIPDDVVPSVLKDLLVSAFAKDVCPVWTKAEKFARAVHDFLSKEEQLSTDVKEAISQLERMEESLWNKNDSLTPATGSTERELNFKNTFQVVLHFTHTTLVVVHPVRGQHVPSTGRHGVDMRGHFWDSIYVMSSWKGGDKIHHGLNSLFVGEMSSFDTERFSTDRDVLLEQLGTLLQGGEQGNLQDTLMAAIDHLFDYAKRLVELENIFADFNTKKEEFAKLKKSLGTIATPAEEREPRVRDLASQTVFWEQLSVRLEGLGRSVPEIAVAWTSSLRKLKAWKPPTPRSGVGPTPTPAARERREKREEEHLFREEQQNDFKTNFEKKKKKTNFEKYQSEVKEVIANLASVVELQGTLASFEKENEAFERKLENLGSTCFFAPTQRTFVDGRNCAISISPKKKGCVLDQLLCGST